MIARHDPALIDDADGTFRTLLLDQSGAQPARIAELPAPPVQARHVPLVATDISEQYDFQAPDWYAIERIRAWSRARTITTTDAGWPLVSCDRRDTGVLCVMGFHIGLAFVETMWWTHSMPDQAEIIRVGTGIDRRLRKFLVNEPPR